MKNWFGIIIFAAAVYSGIMFLGLMHSVGISFGLVKPKIEKKPPPPKKIEKKVEDIDKITAKTQEQRMQEIRDQYEDYMERQKQRMKDYRQIHRKN